MAAATTTSTTSETEVETPDGVLVAVRASQAELARVGVLKMRQALEWAVAHEVMSLDDAMFTDGYGEHGLTLAGPGAPLVETAVVELAAALGVSTDTGDRYVGDCLEIRYRLPRL